MYAICFKNEPEFGILEMYEDFDSAVFSLKEENNCYSVEAPHLLGKLCIINIETGKVVY